MSSFGGDCLTLWLQSAPPYPETHSQVPKLQAPCPEQKFKSKQLPAGITESEMQLLQQIDGAIGTKALIGGTLRKN